jgi:hypothetical protein
MIPNYKIAQEEIQTHYFRGRYQPTNANDCVLIFEKGKGFTIEKLSGSVLSLMPSEKPQNSTLVGVQMPSITSILRKFI